LLKETGIRAGEAWQIERTEIDVEDRTIRVKPEKGSNPRAPRISEKLGHKNIKNTLIYTQLLPFKEDEQFICKGAINTTEACQLIENGFTFVTGEYNDGCKIFKKPK
jgi:hypothetical protein